MSNIKRQAFLSRTQVAARLRRDIHRRGQTLVEYSLILAVISIVAIGVLISMGQQVKSVYSMIDSQITTAGASH